MAESSATNPVAATDIALTKLRRFMHSIGCVMKRSLTVHCAIACGSYGQHPSGLRLLGRGKWFVLIQPLQTLAILEKVHPNIIELAVLGDSGAMIAPCRDVEKFIRYLPQVSYTK
jgi:hypothetical protein